MSRLICRGELIEDRWRWVDVDEAPAPAAGEGLILPLARWCAQRPGPGARVGIC